MQYYEDLISKAPKGFGVDDVKEWLNDTPTIDKFVEIQPLFQKANKDYFYYQALKVIFSQKLLRQEQYDTCLSEKKTETIITDNSNEFNKRVNIFGNKNISLNFKELKSLSLLLVWSCRNLTNIFLENNKEVDCVHLQNLPRLKEVNISKQAKISYLSIRKCNKFEGFESIGLMKDILYLDIGENSTLNDISFLQGLRSLAFLNLDSPNILKNPNTIDILTGLPSLKYLIVRGSNKQRSIVGEALPNCFGNWEN